MVDNTLLVVSDRAIVQVFFSHLAASAAHPASTAQHASAAQPTSTAHPASIAQPAFAIAPATSAAALEDPTKTAGSVAAAVVDVYPDAATAIGVCQALRAARVDLPIVAIGCGRSVSPWEEAELAEHADALLDLAVSTEDARATLRGLLRQGDSRFGSRRRHIRPRQAPRFGLLSQEDARLIEGVAHGLTNEELGRRLHLSRFGVDHRIKRVCLALGVRDRVELAAWAGLHRLYRPRESAANVSFSSN